MVQDLKKKKNKSMELSLLFLNLSVSLPQILCVAQYAQIRSRSYHRRYLTNQYNLLTF